MADLNKLEEHYKEWADNQYVLPSAGVWDRIEASLDAKQKKKGLILPFSRKSYAAIAAAFVGIMTIGIGFFNIIEKETGVQLADDTISTTGVSIASGNAVYVSGPEAGNRQATEGHGHISGNISGETVVLASGNNKHTGSEGLASNDNISTGSSTKMVSGSNGSATAPNQANNKVFTPNINSDLVASNIDRYPVVTYSANGRISAERINYGQTYPLFETGKVEQGKLHKRNAEDIKDKARVETGIFDLYEEQKKAGQRHRVEIGGAISPIYSYRQTTGSSLMAATSSSHSYSEKGLVSAGGGINVNIGLGKKWGIESGVMYARMGQEVTSRVDDHMVYGMTYQNNGYANVKTISLDNSMGMIRQNQASAEVIPSDIQSSAKTQSLLLAYNTTSSNESEATGFSQYIEYLEIPLTFRYYVINNKTRLSLSAGVSTNVLIDNGTYLKEDGNLQKIGETEGLSSMNFSTHAGIAVTVPIAGPLSLRVEPRFNYFLNSINEGYPVKFKPYSAGLYTGLQYSIGR